MTQVLNKTTTVRVVTISRNDSTTDRISVGAVDAAAPMMQAVDFTCPTGTYKIGDQFTYVQTVDTV